MKQQGASPKPLLPAQELFMHIREVGEFYSALVSSGKVNDVPALGRGFFGRSIDERVQMAGLEIEPVLRSAQAFRSR
jgi:hypothetical protein